MPTPQPGVYRKGHEVRVADTTSQAVALAFAGFQVQTAESVAADTDYRELQAQAKALGIPANQGKDALAKAIADHVPTDEVASGSDRPAPDLGYDSLIDGDSADEIAPGADS